MDTSDGRGEIISNSVVKELVKVKIKVKDGEDIIKDISIHDVHMISGGFEGSINEDEIKMDIEAEDEDEDIIKHLFNDN